MPPVTTPIPFTVEELDAIAFDVDGLVPAIVQEQGTNQVLMFAWMNRDALERTLETGRTWFWSRSRQEFWCKGETSGDRQYVRAGYYDGDMDVRLFVLEPEGRGAAHTANPACFLRASRAPLATCARRAGRRPRRARHGPGDTRPAAGLRSSPPAPYCRRPAGPRGLEIVD